MADMFDKYREYFDIDPEYFPQVNEAIITGTVEKVLSPRDICKTGEGYHNRYFKKTESLYLGGRGVRHRKIPCGADLKEVAGRRRR